MEGSPVALFSLKWNNHPAHFSLGLKTLLENDLLTDVTLCTSNGECVRSHKLVLALSSPYFKDLFEMQPHPTDVGTIVILPYVRHKDLVNIIKFIYTGETRVPQQDLKRFLETCNTLKLSINAGKLGLLGDNNQKRQNHEHQQIRLKTGKASPPPPQLRNVTTKPLPPLLTPKQFRKSAANVPNGPATSPLYGIDASSFCEAELKVGGEEAQDHQHGSSPNYPDDTTPTVYDTDADHDQEEEHAQNHHNKRIKREMVVEQAEKTGEIGYKLPMDYSSDDNIVEDEESETDFRNDEGLEREYPEGTTFGDVNGSVSFQDFEDDATNHVSPDSDNGLIQRSLGSRSSGGKSVTICDICGAKFHRKDSYRRHRKSHGAHQYSCEDCGRGFYRRDLFNRHLESQHGKPKVL